MCQNALTNAETIVTTVELAGIIQGGLRYRMAEIQTVGVGGETVLRASADGVHVKPPSLQ